ncbi:MAG: hypothetical protein FWF12_00695 [Betaproteobacteria bacterium]|nr:hypothetical protein [Betaproteobacteria bacterium]
MRRPGWSGFGLYGEALSHLAPGAALPHHATRGQRLCRIPLCGTNLRLSFGLGLSCGLVPPAGEESIFPSLAGGRGRPEGAGEAVPNVYM